MQGGNPAADLLDKANLPGKCKTILDPYQSIAIINHRFSAMVTADEAALKSAINAATIGGRCGPCAHLIARAAE